MLTKSDVESFSFTQQVASHDFKFIVLAVPTGLDLYEYQAIVYREIKARVEALGDPAIEVVEFTNYCYRKVDKNLIFIRVFHEFKGPTSFEIINSHVVIWFHRDFERLFLDYKLMGLF